MAAPCYSAGYLSFGGAMGSSFYTDGYLVSGKKTNINWYSSGIDLQKKLTLTLLKNDAPFRVIATGLAVTNGTTNLKNEWCNDTFWTPGASDMGCHYKFKLSTEDNSVSVTSLQFNIIPADNFTSQGKYTYYSGHKESNDLQRDILILRVLFGAEFIGQSAFEWIIQLAWHSLKLVTRCYLNSGQGSMSDWMRRTAGKF